MKIKRLFSLKNNKSKYFDKLKELKKIFAFLFVSFMFLFLWANRSKLYPENIFLYLEGITKSFSLSDREFSQEIDGQIINFENLKLLAHNPVVLTNNSFTALSPSGKVLCSERHNLNNPFFKTNGIRSIIYDVGGKNLKITSLLNTIYKTTSERNITSCDISANGTYAVLTDSQSYLSEISIFNNKNEEKYKYYFSQIYATDVAMNVKSDRCAVSGISFEESNINSDVYILDFKSEKPECTFKLENNIAEKIMYFSNGNVLVIGNNYLSVINLKLKSVKNFSYEDKFLKFYSFNKDYGLCCCFSPSQNKGYDDEIVLIDNFGKNSKTIKTNENFKCISHFKNRIIGITNTKLISYGIEGKPEGYLDLKQAFKYIVMSSDSSAYAVGQNKVEKIKIKKLKHN